MRNVLFAVLLIGILLMEGCSSGHTASQNQQGALARNATSVGAKSLVLPWRDNKHATDCSFHYVSNNQPVPWSNVVLKTLSLRRVEKRDGKIRYTFQLEDSSDQITCDAVDGKSPSCVYRIVDDTEYKQLNAKYKGKTVWSYGGTKAWCESDRPDTYAELGVDIEPLIISQILRIEGNGSFMVAGTSIGQSVTNPLVVIFKRPQGFSFKALNWTSDGYSEGGTRGTHPAKVMNSGNCSAVWHMVTSSAGMERLYSTSDPFKAHPEWSKATRQAILSGNIHKGMTKEMVMWSRGWPLDSGSLQDIMKLNEWHYQIGPFDQWAKFKNDKVSQWDPGPNLP